MPKAWEQRYKELLAQKDERRDVERDQRPTSVGLSHSVEEGTPARQLGGVKKPSGDCGRPNDVTDTLKPHDRVAALSAARSAQTGMGREGGNQVEGTEEGALVPIPASLMSTNPQNEKNNKTNQNRACMA